MLHNRSTLIMAAVALIGYFLYTRLSDAEKSEVLSDIKQKNDKLVDEYINTELGRS